MKDLTNSGTLGQRSKPTDLAEPLPFIVIMSPVRTELTSTEETYAISFGTTVEEGSGVGFGVGVGIATGVNVGTTVAVGIAMGVNIGTTIAVGIAMGVNIGVETDVAVGVPLFAESRMGVRGTKIVEGESSVKLGVGKISGVIIGSGTAVDTTAGGGEVKIVGDNTLVGIGGDGSATGII